MSNREDLEHQIKELKMDYVRIQGDLDKLESVGGNGAALQKTLARMEDELSRLRAEISKLKE